MNTLLDFIRNMSAFSKILWVEENESNLTYAWRVDSTLNTSIVDGYTNIYSRY